MGDSLAKRSIQARIGTAMGSAALLDFASESPIALEHRHRLQGLTLNLLPQADVSLARFLECWPSDRYLPVGRLYLLPAEQAVQTLTPPVRQQVLSVTLEPGALESRVGFDIDWNNARLRRCLNIESRAMRGLLNRLMLELREPAAKATAMVELLLGQLYVETCRYVCGVDEQKRSQGLARWRVDLIDERIADASRPPPSLEELARLCHLSVRHLTRSFRNSRGQSIAHSLAEARIDRAKQLLRGSSSVQAIATSLGYSSLSNFSAALTRRVGVSPKAYRHQMLGAGRQNSGGTAA